MSLIQTSRINSRNCSTVVWRSLLVLKQRATNEGSLPEIAQYSPYYLPLNVFTASKGSNLHSLFVITAAGVVPCGGPKSLAVHHPKCRLYFSSGPLRSIKISTVFRTLMFRNIILVYTFSSLLGLLERYK